MKLFVAYLGRQNTLIALLLLCGGVFSGVMALYGAPWEAILYGAALCFALGLGILLFSFAAYRRRYVALERALLGLPEDLPPLPESQGPVEEKYQELIRALEGEKRQALDRAAEEGRLAEEYYTTWVHQIKTPIAAMELLLQSGEMDGELLRGELFSIEKQVDLVLTYQRLEGEGTDLVLADYPLDPIIRGAVKEYARLFILKKLTLTFEPTHLTVLTDEKWLRFILGQLLSNALKYTDRGGVTIRAQGQTLVVEDTGVGIEAGEVPRVFERSFTGLNGRASERSTGLGLYLTRKAADMLGHGIAIESTRGRGTRIILDLSRDQRPRE